ncbi:MAG TPA: hypothetical protein VN934_12495 [Candidatus Tumulicola sp.]|nr:hypothetical protein [Candidatus Tumulicola sp.]
MGNLQTVQDENPSSANTKYAYDAAHRLLSATQTLTGTFKLFLSPYGGFRSMQLVRSLAFVSSEGHHRIAYVYHATFENGDLLYTFSFDSDGFVGGVAAGRQKKVSIFLPLAPI